MHAQCLVERGLVSIVILATLFALRRQRVVTAVMGLLAAYIVDPCRGAIGNDRNGRFGDVR